MNNKIEILGNPDEKKGIERLLRQAEQDELIKAVLEGKEIVRNVSFTEKFSAGERVLAYFPGSPCIDYGDKGGWMAGFYKGTEKGSFVISNGCMQCSCSSRPDQAYKLDFEKKHKTGKMEPKEIMDIIRKLQSKSYSIAEILIHNSASDSQEMERIVGFLTIEPEDDEDEFNLALFRSNDHKHNGLYPVNVAFDYVAEITELLIGLPK